MWKRYGEIGLDVVAAFIAYRFLGWLGFALWSLFVVGWFAVQIIGTQQMIMKTLLSRLPDRCAFCHREIVDEGGVFDADGTYHEACSDKLESLDALRHEAGVSSSEAIHRSGHTPGISNP